MYVFREIKNVGFQNREKVNKMNAMNVYYHRVCMLITDASYLEHSIRENTSKIC